jgi:hypothetical protein
VLPGVELQLYDRHPERAAALAEIARATDGVADARPAADARDAVRDADVVVTAASFGPVRQVMTSDWLAPDALVVPVDYATYCAADVAAGAALFLVDQREQFLANRDAGNFDGYPDPMGTLGEAIVGGHPAAGEWPGRRQRTSALARGPRLRAAILDRAIAGSELVSPPPEASRAHAAPRVGQTCPAAGPSGGSSR